MMTTVVSGCDDNWQALHVTDFFSTICLLGHRDHVANFQAMQNGVSNMLSALIVGLQCSMPPSYLPDFLKGGLVIYLAAFAGYAAENKSVQSHACASDPEIHVKSCEGRSFPLSWLTPHFESTFRMVSAITAAVEPVFNL